MNSLRLIGLWFQIRYLEITLYGQEEALLVVRDPETINRIVMARFTCRNELHRVVSQYKRLKRGRNPWKTI